MSRLLFQGVAGIEDISESLRKSAKCRSFDSAESVNADLRPEIDDPKLREECGVIAIHGYPDAARMAYLGLYALQHRGQESAGIATADGQHLANIKGMGLVS
jgi:amidophosphoribosyltransferase